MPQSSNPSLSLYAKYGGLPTVTKVVQDFYRRINLERSLDRFFKDIDMAVLIDHQVAFVCKALGGPDNYEGRELKKAHQRFAIDHASFALVAELLRQALVQAGVTTGDVSAVLALIGGLENEIVSDAA